MMKKNNINMIELLKNKLYSDPIYVKVASVIKDTSKSKILVLKPSVEDTKLPMYFPLQYINIFYEIDGVNYLESFPLFRSSNHEEDEYRIVVKNNKKKKLQKYLFDNINYEDELLISRPMGDFNFSVLREEKNIIAIGYDNDIVSFYDLANYLIHYKLDYKLNIIHICSNENNVILKEKFEKVSTFNECINYEYVILDDDKIVDIKPTIHKYLKEFNSFFISGNVEFYKKINEVISDYNLPKKNLRFRKFTPIINRNSTESYKLRLMSIEQVLEIDCCANESILKSIMKSPYAKNVLLNNDLTDDIMGEVIQGSVATVDKFDGEANVKNDVINLSLSYPCGNVTIKLI